MTATAREPATPSRLAPTLPPAARPVPHRSRPMKTDSPASRGPSVPPRRHRAAALAVALAAGPAGPVDAADAAASAGGVVHGISDGTRAEIEGVVTGIDGAASFVVDGVRVDASASGVPPQLAAGARVEVEGRFAAGRLHATKVEIDRDTGGTDDGLQIEGDIAALDAAAKTLVLHGVSVDWTDARFEDGSAADLAVGRRVEVQGAMTPDGRTLRATEVDFER
ncbi:MAG: DUF5666 domain-containing protein [Comamonadaceae bacterium]|nr:DUF5666 domain-containing protein [Comamonadaceae bacterium]